MRRTRKELWNGPITIQWSEFVSFIHELRDSFVSSLHGASTDAIILIPISGRGRNTYFVGLQCTRIHDKH